MTETMSPSVRALLEEVLLVGSILSSKIQNNELPLDFPVHVFDIPWVLTRAYQKLFTQLEVCDGVIPRFGNKEEGNLYGEKGFFFFHDPKSRGAIPGRFTFVDHSWLVFKQTKETTPNDNTQPIIDVLSPGTVPSLRFVQIIYPSHRTVPYHKTKLPVTVTEKDLVKDVLMVYDCLKEISESLSS
jgi:hypothetical protein